jgi:hypothetical protein
LPRVRQKKGFNALPGNERAAFSDEAMAYCDKLQKAWQLLAASLLHPVETATTVRVHAGKTFTTDGPSAETKEQLGGFLMIDVPDLNGAIRINGLNRAVAAPMRDGPTAGLHLVDTFLARGE